MNNYAILCDLDGTLVITDDIYLEVWTNILLKYNISLNQDLYKKFIQGHSDGYVIKTLLPNININIAELSTEKDDSFIKNISKIKVVEGVYEFLKSLKTKNYKCSIITNCNKKVANEICNYIKINEYIDYLICADDCKNNKPHPEPYLKGLEKYNLSNDNVFIFEDSKTGLLSAKNINPKCLVGIETLYDNIELLNYGADISIKNFVNFNIDNLISYENGNIGNLKKLIKNSLNMNINDIIIDESKLKGGFIADIISIIIKSYDLDHFCVLKYENKNITGLSIMANKLQLYEREYYFYQHISREVNIKVPKFYGLIKDKTYNNIGVVLENLNINRNYKINLDLSNESIDISLKIINRIAKMHAKFWGKDLNKIFPKLKKNNDITFNPFFQIFVSERIETFKNKWKNIFSDNDLELCEKIANDFQNIQNRLSSNNLTLVHNDIKSPNIFYDLDDDCEPIFLDWQHSVFGKGTQDLMFFIIESFDVSKVDLLYPIFKNYYYSKLIEYNVQNYSYQEYEQDIIDSVCYVPFFTTAWFSSVPNDELIDQNFPFFFTKSFLHMLKLVNYK